MAVVNMNNLLNGKDSRWLQLEVCREYQRNKCSRPDTDCKFAHPAANVEVQNGRVTACYDSIKVLERSVSLLSICFSILRWRLRGSFLSGALTSLEITRMLFSHHFNNITPCPWYNMHKSRTRDILNYLAQPVVGWTTG